MHTEKNRDINKASLLLRRLNEILILLPSTVLKVINSNELKKFKAIDCFAKNWSSY